MRKLIVPLLGTLLFITCKKHDPETKIEVCHKDQKEGTSHTITINANELLAHLAHGDLVGKCPAATTTICDQIWMVKNLDVDHYRNGDPIPQVTDPAAWAALTTGAWCYSYNDPAFGAIYGKLYNWYAVNDPRGLAPVGWHIPSNGEWETLVNCLGGEYVAGGKLKEIGTTHWLDPNIEATNETGFTALPGNIRLNNGEFHQPFPGQIGDWWTSSEYNFDSFFYASHKFMYNFSGSVQNGADDKGYGFSVRCVRD